MTSPLRVRSRILGASIAASALALGGCFDYTPAGPQRAVQVRHVAVLCKDHGGVRNLNTTLYNPGAMAPNGVLDYACNDGIAGTLGWDSQGPNHLPGPR